MSKSATKRLHQAVSAGDVAGVRRALKNGADVNAQNEIGMASLHLATTAEVVEVLLAHGAELEAESIWTGCVPLAVAGKAEVAAALIAHGADPCRVDSAGRTLLHYNCHAGNLGVVEVLVAHGADPQALSRKGQTPIDEAIGRPDKDQRHAAIALVLFEAIGLSPVAEYKGQTLLEVFAVDATAKEVIKDAQRRWRANGVREEIADTLGDLGSLGIQKEAGKAPKKGFSL